MKDLINNLYFDINMLVINNLVLRLIYSINLYTRTAQYVTTSRIYHYQRSKQWEEVWNASSISLTAARAKSLSHSLSLHKYIFFSFSASYIMLTPLTRSNWCKERRRDRNIQYPFFHYNTSPSCSQTESQCCLWRGQHRPFGHDS